MRYKYRGCEILIREFSGMYQAMVKFTDGTNATTKFAMMPSAAMSSAEDLIDEWSKTA